MVLATASGRACAKGSARSSSAQKYIHCLLYSCIEFAIGYRHAQHRSQLELALHHVYKLKGRQFRIINLQHTLLNLNTQVAGELLVDTLGALGIEKLLYLLSLATAVGGDQTI